MSSWGVNPVSFLHLAASHGEVEYVLHRLGSIDKIAAVSAPGTNLLLSAAVAPNPDVVRHLLDRGQRPNDLLLAITRLGAAPTLKVTVWEAFLLRLGRAVAEFCELKANPKIKDAIFTDAEDLEGLAVVLEALIRAGGDPAVQVLLAPAVSEPDNVLFVNDIEAPGEVYRTDLPQLLEIFKPKNQEALNRLIVRTPPKKTSSLRRFWRRSEDRQSPKIQGGASEYPRIPTKRMLEEPWNAIGVVSEGGDRVVQKFAVRWF